MWVSRFRLPSGAFFSSLWKKKSAQRRRGFGNESHIHTVIFAFLKIPTVLSFGHFQLQTSRASRSAWVQVMQCHRFSHYGFFSMSEIFWLHTLAQSGNHTLQLSAAGRLSSKSIFEQQHEHKHNLLIRDRFIRNGKIQEAWYNYVTVTIQMPPWPQPHKTSYYRITWIDEISGELLFYCYSTWTLKGCKSGNLIIN